MASAAAALTFAVWSFNRIIKAERKELKDQFKFQQCLIFICKSTANKRNMCIS